MTKEKAKQVLSKKKYEEKADEIYQRIKSRRIDELYKRLEEITYDYEEEITFKDDKKWKGVISGRLKPGHTMEEVKEIFDKIAELINNTKKYKPRDRN